MTPGISRKSTERCTLQRVSRQKS